MIIRISHNELDKFPRDVYEDAPEEIVPGYVPVLISAAPYKADYLLQHFNGKNPTFDLICRISGDLEAFVASEIIYTELDTDADIPDEFSLINTPGNITPKTFEDIIYIVDNSVLLDQETIDNMHNINEFKLTLETIELAEMVEFLAEEVAELKGV